MGRLWLFPKHLAALLRNWNWKAAILSASWRTPIFILTTMKYGWRRMSLAASIEIVYRMVSSGFFACIIQSFRSAKPTWHSLSIVAILIPVATLAADGAIHHVMGTPNLKTGIALSFALTVIVSLFTWHGMSRGVLIVGNGSRSFVGDLRALPAVIIGFPAELSLWVLRNLKKAL
jgi:hypothetical protein